MGQIISQVLRDQIWQGIAGLATIISTALTVHVFFSQRSKDARKDALIEELINLLRGEVMNSATAPPKKKRRKKPLIGQLVGVTASRALFYLLSNKQPSLEALSA